MDFDEMAYPDTFQVNGAMHKGRRDGKKSEILIPYTDEPNIGIGDEVTHKSGGREIYLKVLDTDFLPEGSLNVGTSHPHMLTLSVENLSAAEHRAKNSPTVISIGSISGHQVQVGNQNTQITNISLTEFVKKVATSGDQKAKSLLREVLENNTVAGIVGAAATTLLAALAT